MKRVSNELLKERIEFLIGMITRHIEDDKKAFDKIDEAFDGNGHAGLKTRLDRLEQSAFHQRWAIRAFWVAVLGVSASYIGGLLR